MVYIDKINDYVIIKKKRNVTNWRNMITITEVAKKAGVSPTTASYALNGRDGVKAETREKVLKVAKELNYIPNKIAQSFRNGKTRTITVITNELIERDNTFTGEFFGILSEARKQHYDVLIKLIDNREMSEHKINTIFSNRVSDGFLLLGNFPELYLKSFVESKSCGILISSHTDEDILQVNCDGKSGIYNITKLAIKKGHKKLEYLTYQYLTEEEKLRFSGFKDAVKENKIGNAEISICGFDRGSIYKTVFNCIKKGTSCFICWNDTLAYTVINILEEMDIKIPEQVSVTGFDDIIPTTGEAILTTVHQPLFEKGRKATELLLAQINHDIEPGKKNNFFVESHIVERKSL